MKDARSRAFQELKPGDYVVHENHGVASIRELKRSL